jgi:hypothetical protein
MQLLVKKLAVLRMAFFVLLNLGNFKKTQFRFQNILQRKIKH